DATSGLDLTYTYMSSGVATIDFANWLGVGTHTLRARFEGDADYLQSTSEAVTITIARAPTQFNLSISENVMLGSSITLTALLTNPADYYFAGTIHFTDLFMDTSIALGDADITIGQDGQAATLTLDTLAVGDHLITASFL